MIERQRRDHHFLPFANDRVTVLAKLLHVGPHLLHVGHQVAVGQHGALGHAGGAAGVLQHRHLVEAQRYRPEAVPSAVVQRLFEGHRLWQAIFRHHFLHMLDRGVDQQALQCRQHVADSCLDEKLDIGIGQHLLHQLAEGIEVDQRPGTRILELMAHFPRGVQRVGVDHDQPGAQGAEHGDRILQEIGHLHGNAIAGLEVGVILQPGGKGR